MSTDNQPTYEQLADLADLIIGEQGAGKPPFEVARAAWRAGYRKMCECGKPICAEVGHEWVPCPHCGEDTRPSYTTCPTCGERTDWCKHCKKIPKRTWIDQFGARRCSSCDWRVDL